jgi:hypothetical protein
MAARVSLLLLAIFLLRDFPFVSHAGGFETRLYKCQPILDARMNGWLVTEALSEVTEQADQDNEWNWHSQEQQ